MTAPLEGIRVVEVSTWLAAPAAGALMADLGADVIKIEAPGGDPWRHYDPASMGFDHPFPINYGFEFDNRGKRSMVIDLERPSGAAVARRLCEDADVFISNVIRSERWGLDPARLRAANPSLICASVSAYGSRGPDVERPGYDYTAYWARSGIMGLSGEPSSPPAFNRTGQGDHATSLNLFAAIMVALRTRDLTGEGQTVEVNLMQSGMWTIAADLSAALMSGEQPRRYDREQPWNPIRNSYRTRDGRWLLLGMTQPDRFWPRFVAMLGDPEWARDPRFETLASRKQHGRELRERLDEAFATADLDEWARRLDEARFPWEPIPTLPEVIDDPQVEVNGMLAQLEHPEVGPYRTLAAPFRISGAETSPRGPAPAPGEQTSEILEELGLDEDEIADLAADGAFG